MAEITQIDVLLQLLTNADGEIDYLRRRIWTQSETIKKLLNERDATHKLLDKALGESTGTPLAPLQQRVEELIVPTKPKMTDWLGKLQDDYVPPI